MPYEDDDTTDEQNPVKVLRDANKALKKELDEAREAMAKLSAQARTSTVRDALSDLKGGPSGRQVLPLRPGGHAREREGVVRGEQGRVRCQGACPGSTTGAAPARWRTEPGRCP